MTPRTLRVLVFLAGLVLLANLGVLAWLYSAPLPALPRTPAYDLGPGEQAGTR